MRLELARNQHPVRMVVAPEITARQLEQARRERENHRRRLRRMQRTPQERAKDAAYQRARRAAPDFLERDRERKARWRAKNRKKVNAYFRSYEALTPGRREYKAAKAREYRARDRALREASA